MYTHDLAENYDSQIKENPLTQSDFPPSETLTLLRN